jgi:pimeloyl-ACP methyl ester carboxylesterase
MAPRRVARESGALRLGRRDLGIGLAAGLFAEGDEALVVRSARFAHEVVFAWPRAATRAVPLVILLHGLAETSDETLGSRAWIDRYGLAGGVARCAAARDRAYRGLAFACPFVPKMWDAGLDAYVRWLVESLVPAARAEIGAPVDDSPPRIGGCSYGGWVSLEAVIRAPDKFGAWAGVQTAIGRASAPGYAARLAPIARGRPLLIETSTLDPFRDANVALAASLRERGVACDHVVLPGPHDQPWLRRAGTPEMIAWLDRT